MTKFTFFLFFLTISISSFCQDNSLVTKQKELSAAEEALKQAQAKVDALKADVNALTPKENWKKGGFSSLNFNSLGLTNWAAGGVQSNSVNALGNLYANYSRDKIEWVNNLDLAYGLIQNQGEDIRKNEDKIDFLTKVGRKASEKLNYTALFNFKSQFAPGYDFTDPDENRPAISNLLAPAYILTSLGIDYKVTDYLSVFMSPATGKFTIVNDDSIAAMNAYIPATTDEDGVQFYNNNFRAEFGALVNVILAKDLTKRINLKSTLNLFNNYTDKNSLNRKNIDVNWETMLNMKLTDYIGASLFTHVIYDNDVNIPIYNEAGLQTGQGPRTQFKRVFGIGFSYKF
jgi:hypothetical protein